MNRFPLPSHLTSPFLAGLSQAELDAILSAASRRVFSAKTVITEEGDLANRAFLLISGRARYFFLTEDGKKVILHWIVPGEVIGAMTLLLEPMSYIVSSETVRQSSMLVWERDAIRNLLGRYPRLLDNSLSFAAYYMMLARIGYAALICDDARERLANVLVELAKCLGHPLDDGIELDVTNEELASAAHITIFSVSRLLNEWQRKGIITKSRGRIVILAPTELVLEAAYRKHAGNRAEVSTSAGHKARAFETIKSSLNLWHGH
jgi:CRP/FNR family transcriptional regulator, nitrogen oxide reductase regulator